MPCTAPVRGKTDTKYPWDPDIQNDPCGVPDVYAGGLCKLHWQMANGLVFGTLDPATVFLLHADSLVDERGHPLTAFGDAKIDLTQSKFGSGSLALDGTGDYITSPDSPDWAFGSGDFTVDLWAYFTNTGAPTQTLIGQFGSGAGCSWMLRFNATFLNFYYSTDGATNPSVQWTWIPTANTWYHLAVVRSGTNMLFFVNGVQVGTPLALSGALFDSAIALSLGANAVGAWAFFGNLDEVRISKGIARWVANFTPPSAPY